MSTGKGNLFLDEGVIHKQDSLCSAYEVTKTKLDLDLTEFNPEGSVTVPHLPFEFFFIICYNKEELES